MSVRLVETSQQALTTPFSGLSYPYTLFAWVYWTSGVSSGDPVNGGAMRVLALKEAGTTDNLSGIHINGTTVAKAGWGHVTQHLNGAQSAVVGNNSIDPPLSTWIRIMGVFTATSITSYFGTETPDVTTGTYTTPSYDVLEIGRLNWSSMIQHFRGRIAEAAVWSSALNATDYSELATKSPALVQPGTLDWYRPLIAQANGEVHEVGSENLSLVNTPTFSAGTHPSLLYPSILMMRRRRKRTITFRQSPVSAPTANSVDRAYYIAAAGSGGLDTNNGTTTGTPLATLSKARELALTYLTANPNKVLGFYLNKGDTFSEDFGDLELPGKVRINGTDGTTPCEIGAYGTGARPIINATNDFVRMIRENRYFKISGLEIRGGTVRNISNQTGFYMDDCVLDGCSIVSQAQSGNEFTDLSITNTTVMNVVSPTGSHRAGIFIDRTAAGTGVFKLSNLIIYNNGWEEDGVTGSDRSQGIYITGACGPVTESNNVIAIKNAGAGVQYRSAGNVNTVFAAWNGARGINWGETRGAKTSETGGTGTLTNFALFQVDGPGLAIGNLASGTVTSGTVLNTGYNSAMNLNAQYGPNTGYGGSRFGLNALTIASTVKLINFNNGGPLRLQYDGWGYLGGDGVDCDAEYYGGSFVYDANYSDPLGKLDLTGMVENASLSSTTYPTETAALISDILDGTVTAADLVSTYGAH